MRCLLFATFFAILLLHVADAATGKAAGISVTFTAAGKSDTRTARLCALYVPKGAPATPFLPVGPFTAKPNITTGAGDHFNAGFCVGRMLGLGLAESLQTGVATSGFYVRSAKSPAAADLVKFLRTL